MKKTSNFENALLWFGAGVSIAEIITGTYFLELGFKKAIIAIVIGHIIGGILLYLSGVIGANTKKSSMENVKMNFGNKGGMIFASLNVVQLVGWTAIMIYDGAISASHIFNTSHIAWALLIGILIILWIKIGIEDLGKLNTISMTLLFLLTIFLSFKIFKTISIDNNYGKNSMSFGAAVELAVAMPLSWLPLISDYTKDAKDKNKAPLVSAIVYSFISIWMYIIGLGMALVTKESDIALIMIKAGLSIFAMLIIILSTVTTTFLDAYSAGISFQSISTKIESKKIAIAVTIIGTIAAIIYPMDNITNFLYLIGSVFAPMISVQITDYFILKNKETKDIIHTKNLIIWLLGFIFYRIFLNMDLFLGATISSMILVIILKMISQKLFEK